MIQEMKHKNLFIHYLLLVFLAFGLSMSMLFGVKYHCSGQEMFPEYYGSPFVFKRNSQASSMEYYFSLFGLLANTAIWAIVLQTAYFLVKPFFKNKIIHRLFSIALIVLVLFSVLSIGISFLEMGRGFSANANYWYWDMEKEARAWGMTCSGSWGFMIDY